MNACIVARFLGSVGTMVTCVGVKVLVLVLNLILEEQSEAAMGTDVRSV